MKVGDTIVVNYHQGHYNVTDYKTTVKKIINSPIFGISVVFQAPPPNLGNPSWYVGQEWQLSEAHFTNISQKPRKVINA